MAIIEIEGSSDTYTIDTVAVTCGCRDFSFRRSHYDINHPERLCKHLLEVKDQLEPYKVADGRIPYETVKPLVEELKSLISFHKGVSKSQFTGSFRRLSDTVKDLDCIVYGDDVPGFFEFITSMDEVKTLWKGDVKCSIIYKGVQVDFMRVVDLECWPFALLHFTGSKSTNILMRKEASRRGMRLNEYGLFLLDDNGEPVSRYLKQDEQGNSVELDSEYDIFIALHMKYVVPDER